MHNGKHNTDAQRRRIRSFVRREGRLTPGQQNALDALWPRFGLPAESVLDPVQVFGRSAPLTLEIGFGNGGSLAAMAAHDPQSDFIGIEVHRPGVGHLLIELEERSLSNVRVYCHDAVEVLERCIPDACLDRVLLFFPDPWPKRKHHKRRILQPEFVERVARKLKTGGLFHMATDWEHYARHMLSVMQSAEDFVNCDTAGAYSERPEYRPVTRFEQRGQRLGHGVRDLVFRRG
ncbi:MAG: tRNA (guanosine(46)-N7)-methyltransferase TrmB [Thiogranum sp.]